KNEKNILPLNKNLKRIAVIGPNADNFEALLGHYNGIPKHPVTVLEGIKTKMEPATEVLYSEGSDLAEGIHNLVPIPGRYFQTESGQQGVVGDYFNNSKLEGKPVFTRIDDQINFYWESGSPSPKLPDDNFSIRWTGYLVPPETGTYSIGCWGMPTLNVFLEGEKILSYNSVHSGFHLEKSFDLQAGKRYKIVYEYKNWAADADAKLLWSLPSKDKLQKAVDLANSSDAVVLVLGLSQRLEGEEMRIKVDGFAGGDRTSLNLPKVQQELMESIKKTGKPVIMVLMNGSALSINWAAENIDAILCAGYAGQEGGDAVADVIFGDYNPAGRLPVTWYKSLDQLPPFENYDMQGRTYRYFKGEPLYPFGFGLSYTTFNYSDLNIPQKSETVKPISVSVKVTNSGKKAGDEVVELYLTKEKASALLPIRQLVGFERVSLLPGESKLVSFTVDPRKLSYVNDKAQRIVEAGNYSVSVGGTQPGFSGRTDVATTGVVSGKFKLTGETIKLEL
ncbi:MAG: glycoside hydrolase family 3 C-terminal domain-containing protein, partial [Bacteroidota bacterium]|nr:glycoside hydrolase family 3 C-terminal domain-containing protein [Bacteroidota bacterium]